jgi:hypothetical protein
MPFKPHVTAFFARRVRHCMEANTLCRHVAASCMANRGEATIMACDAGSNQQVSDKQNVHVAYRNYAKKQLVDIIDSVRSIHLLTPSITLSITLTWPVSSFSLVQQATALHSA